MVHLISLTEGDLRKAITLLQSTKLLKDQGEDILPEDINRVVVVWPNLFTLGLGLGFGLRVRVRFRVQLGLEFGLGFS